MSRGSTSHPNNTNTTNNVVGNNNNGGDATKSLEEELGAMRSRLIRFVVFLVFDLAVTVGLFVVPVPLFDRWEGIHDLLGRYTFYGSVWDIGLLAAVRVLAALGAIGFSLHRRCYGSGVSSATTSSSSTEQQQQKEDDDEEEEDNYFCKSIRRFVSRQAFACEACCVLSQLLCVSKCLVRMYVEIGKFQDTAGYHPMFWLLLAATTVFSIIECSWVASIAQTASDYHEKRTTHHRQQQTTTTNDNNNDSALSVPLLSAATDDSSDNPADLETVSSPLDSDSASSGTTNASSDESNFVAESELSADTAKYKATTMDLLGVILPDGHYILLAFVFLILAAIAQVYIPKLTGNILDSLAETFSNHNHDHINATNTTIFLFDDKDPDNRPSIFDVPGFIPNVKLLILAAVLGGIFSGLRGSIFTIVGGRVNVRLRILLMDSLLVQDIGFYDTTKIGDITSRLSSDTTLVGDQVTLNVNVFLRSLVQAIGVLIFMFVLSWQLSIVAFISVPVITILSRWYGEFLRTLTKAMQKKLADGNSISESVLGSMSTVRAFDGSRNELEDFCGIMNKYLSLNIKSAIAYCGYAAAVVALPQLVISIVIFYGGLLVRNDDMTAGQLVSFILYLQSLSDAFASIGYIFSALTQAVGAADKVFELIHRTPKSKVATTGTSNTTTTTNHNNNNNDNNSNDDKVCSLSSWATKVKETRISGYNTCEREHESSNNNGYDIEFRSVEMYYPARPKRRILNELTMDIPRGSVVALVGPSGGGKSSIMSLLQQLYDASSGTVCIDGRQVHEYSPSWIARNISVVSQEPTLFAKSIRKNIVYGLENTTNEPTMEEIVLAAKLANAHSFIQSLPQGYDTECGERGVQLSGGQKQRIAIARALVRKPKVLLLDEATSALDSESEHMVQKAIDKMISRGRRQGHNSNNNDDDIFGIKEENGSNNLEGNGMTVIIVAHRLSTIRNADSIFVIQDGQVKEQGTHKELIQNLDGPYSSLVRRQIESEEMLNNNSSNDDDDAGIDD